MNDREKKLQEALKNIVDELNRYAIKNGLGPARLQHALVQGEVTLAIPETAVLSEPFDAKAFVDKFWEQAGDYTGDRELAEAAYKAGLQAKPAQGSEPQCTCAKETSPAFCQVHGEPLYRKVQTHGEGNYLSNEEKADMDLNKRVEDELHSKKEKNVE